MEIAPGVHHFDTHPFNWYVIAEGSRLTLVDAGFPGHHAVFVEGLRSIGRTVSDVEAVILTHAHADHMGFADRVRQEAGATVYIHRADREASGRVLQLPWWGLLSRVWQPFTAAMLARGIANGVFSSAHVREARSFDDGDTLDVPGRPRVIHVPGHTPGETAFYLPERGVLFSGDALVTQNLYDGSSGRPVVPSAPLNSNTRQAYQSLDRFAGLGRVRILPGHGKPWDGPIDEAVEIARSNPAVVSPGQAAAVPARVG